MRRVEPVLCLLVLLLTMLAVGFSIGAATAGTSITVVEDKGLDLGRFSYDAPFDDAPERAVELARLDSWVQQPESVVVADASPHVYVSSSSFVTPRTTSWLDNAATGRVPDGWGAGTPNRSGVGTRWTDPSNPGNGIRIDQGNPAVSLTTQQVDHVVVRHNGVVIGRDGSPIPGAIREYPELAHIPLDEWLTWSEWFKP